MSCPDRIIISFIIQISKFSLSKEVDSCQKDTIYLHFQQQLAIHLEPTVGELMKKIKLHHLASV